MGISALDVFQGKTFNIVTIIVALIGLTIAIFGAYYARAALFPARRRISVTMKHPTSLLSDASTAISGIEVIRNHQPLTEPHIVEISIENTGRHDIESAKFDLERPLRIEIGATLVDVLKVSTNPISRTIPTYAIDGPSSITVGPDLIKRRSRIEIQILADGIPELHCSEHLIDTKLSTHVGISPENERLSAKRLNQTVSSLLMLIAVVSVSALTYSTHQLASILEVSPMISVSSTESSKHTWSFGIQGRHFSPNSLVTILFTCNGVIPIGHTDQSDSQGNLGVVLNAQQIAYGEKCTISAFQIKPKFGIANVTLIVAKP